MGKSPRAAVYAKEETVKEKYGKAGRPRKRDECVKET
jgi:hypothetical protein